MGASDPHPPPQAGGVLTRDHHHFGEGVAGHTRPWGSNQGPPAAWEASEDHTGGVMGCGEMRPAGHACMHASLYRYTIEQAGHGKGGEPSARLQSGHSQG
jgi:hypothetical protein